MTTAADQLHTAIFGSHTHPCPSESCKGRRHSCSVQYDCQPGPKLCVACYELDEHLRYQRNAWRQVDRVFQKGVGV